MNFFQMCCVNRSKDDLGSDITDTARKPIDFIRDKPDLVRVLKWFEEHEDRYRENMRGVPETIDRIISLLDEQSEEEILKLKNRNEVVVKVVADYNVAEVLNFDDGDSS